MHDMAEGVVPLTLQLVLNRYLKSEEIDLNNKNHTSTTESTLLLTDILIKKQTFLKFHGRNATKNKYMQNKANIVTKLTVTSLVSFPFWTQSSKELSLHVVDRSFDQHRKNFDVTNSI